MEYCWRTLFNNSNASTVRGHNGNCTPNPAWEGEEEEEQSMDDNSREQDHWSTFPLHHSFNFPPPPATAADSVFHALMMHHDEKTKEPPPRFFTPDPHLTCLKLGKRHYFEDGTPPPPPEAEAAAACKKGKSYADGEASAAVVVPRCQVEGCAVLLVNAKDYHRRHKVCEMHAKAPKVVVGGIEQRFCQQCSRFHAVAEFDEAKRSCRRRLAGHNERRRKSSQEQNALARRHSQDFKMMGVGRHTQTQILNNSECALSLLSSNHYNTPWTTSTSPDLPARCSAALHELIAENRASLLACRQIEEYKLGSIRAGPNPQGSGGGHVTLNLMQAPNSAAFGLLSMHDHNKSSKDDHDCSDLWKLPLGY
ncbi:hypothetical protein ACS0TY_019606 [Phlomoides rotata]